MSGEELWQLPDTWRWVTFQDVAEVRSDLNDPAATPDAVHIAPNHIESGTGRLLARGTVAGDEVTSPKHAFHPGQILYSKIRPYLAKAVLVDFEGLCSADMYPVSVVPELMEAAFLHRWLVSPAFTDAASDSQGRTVLPKINQAALNTKQVPLAPLAEQRRISAKIEALLAKAYAGRQRLDRVPAILKRFRQSMLAAATSGELTREWREERGLSAGWVNETLGRTGDVTGGITKNRGRTNAPLMKPYLRVANVYANRLELSEIAKIATTSEEYARTRLQQGDILIVEGNGSVDQIGRAAMWQGELEECAHQNHLIRWRSRGQVVPAFTLIWLLSPSGRGSLMEVAKSSAGLFTLSLSKVAAVPLQIPTLEEQQEIVTRVSRLLAVADQLEDKVQKARVRVERAVAATLAKAFRGELVPQDPNDEPASVMLERLRAQRDAVVDQEEPRPRTRAPSRSRSPGGVVSVPSTKRRAS